MSAASVERTQAPSPTIHPGQGQAPPLDPHPDYVITFSLKTDKEAKGNGALVQEYEVLRATLRTVGLAVTSRSGAKGSEELLIFVKASDERVKAEAEHERVQDWLNGVGVNTIPPTSAKDYDADPIHPADRLRYVYSILTSSTSPTGQACSLQLPSTAFPHITSIFPPHEPNFHFSWNWSTLRISHASLTNLAHSLGPQIALYFAFLQTYLHFLVFPAVLGLLFTLAKQPFSPVYTLGLASWSIVFLESWKLKEKEYAVLWGTHDSHRVEPTRAAWGKSGVWETVGRQAVTAGMLLVAAAGLGGLISSIYAVETLIGEAYDGPLKQLMTLIPTILFVGVVPQVVGGWNTIAEKLTIWEDHARQSEHDRSLARKVFGLRILVAFGSLLLTSFVYIPFGKSLVPWILKLLSRPTFHTTTESYSINSSKLHTQIVAYTMTNQAIGAVTEYLVPFVLARVQARMNGSNTPLPDKEDEKAFLTRVREEASRPEYEVFADYSEMVIQFGYLVLFSAIWPISPLWSLVNNYFEIRGDAFKLTKQSRRPIPTRDASIGPWLEILTFLTWFGALTHTALVYLYRPGSNVLETTPPKTALYTALLLALVSEHLYLLISFAVRFALVNVAWQSNWAARALEEKDKVVRAAGLSGVGGVRDLDEGKGLEFLDKAKRATVANGESAGVFWDREDEGLQLVRSRTKTE